MSVRAGKDYLYLIWKSEKSRRQYIVGQLTKNGGYKFQYSNEVHDAIKDAFSPLLSFDDLEKTYSDEKLFSVFASRLPDRKRRDINKILEKYFSYLRIKIINTHDQLIPVAVFIFNRITDGISLSYIPVIR